MPIDEDIKNNCLLKSFSFPNIYVVKENSAGENHTLNT